MVQGGFITTTITSRYPLKKANYRSTTTSIGKRYIWKNDRTKIFHIYGFLPDYESTGLRWFGFGQIAAGSISVMAPEITVFVSLCNAIRGVTDAKMWPTKFHILASVTPLRSHVASCDICHWTWQFYSVIYWRGYFTADQYCVTVTIITWIWPIPCDCEQCLVTVW